MMVMVMVMVMLMMMFIIVMVVMIIILIEVVTTTILNIIMIITILLAFITSVVVVTSKQLLINLPSPSSLPPSPAEPGGWSGWSVWSSCSRSCGSGVTSRIRTCTAPSPAYGGQECSGKSSEIKACKLRDCCEFSMKSVHSFSKRANARNEAIVYSHGVSFPSLKSTLSQPFIEKFISDTMRM